jgi:hypothetical protein
MSLIKFARKFGKPDRGWKRYMARRVVGGKIFEFGGAGRDRTGDLIVANDALSQLSYSPTVG